MLLGALYALFFALFPLPNLNDASICRRVVVYFRRATGDFSGFMVGCSDLVMQTGTTAYLDVAFGEFAGALQPAFRGHVKLLAVGVLMKPHARTASLVKALAPLAFVVACFLAGHNVGGVDASSAQVLPSGGLLAFVMARGGRSGGCRRERFSADCREERLRLVN